MPDIVYKVELDFETKQSGGGVSGTNQALTGLQSKAAQVQDSFAGLGAAASGVFSGMQAVAAPVVGMFTGIVDSLIHMAGAATLAGAALAGMQLKEGFDFANKLESTALSMGTIFRTQGYVGDMATGLAVANVQLDKMKQDAKALPGEFADLANIMRTIAAPAGHLGMSVDQMRQMSTRLMVAGSVSGLDMQQVARESAMMLEGRFGAHNILGTRLGMGHEMAALQKSDPEKFVQKLTTELGKFDEAIPVFTKSFDGLWSTFKDTKRIFLSDAMKPLFNQIKGQLEESNKWFETHKDTVDLWAYQLGTKLSDAFEFGRNKIVEWWPAIESFASHAKSELISIWERVSPYVDKAFSSLKDALADGSALNKLESVLELYAALKIGGFVAPMAGGIAQLAEAAGAGGAIAGALPVGALLAAGGAGQAHAMASEDSLVHQQAGYMWDDLKRDTKELEGNFVNLAEKLGVVVLPVIDTLGLGLTGLADSVVKVTSWILSKLPGGKEPKTDKELQDERVATALDRVDMVAQRFWEQAPMTRHAINEKTGYDATTAKHKATPPAGGHTTNIGKVEITVSSNHDPARIARVVYQHMQDAALNPKKSTVPRPWYNNMAAGY